MSAAFRNGQSNPALRPGSRRVGQNEFLRAIVAAARLMHDISSSRQTMKPEPEDSPQLRMASYTPEQLARQIEREQLTANRDREFGLEQSLAGFRVGSVHALNAVPLTRG